MTRKIESYLVQPISPVQNVKNEENPEQRRKKREQDDAGKLKNRKKPDNEKGGMVDITI